MTRYDPKKAEAAASNPAGQQTGSSHDLSQSIVPIRQSLFTTTPALKAGRTRAWRTLKVFSQEEVEASSPSYSFVRLKLTKEVLEQSGVPVIKTRWEEQFMQQAGPDKRLPIPFRVEEVGISAGGRLDKVGIQDHRAMHLSTGDAVDTEEGLGQSTNQNCAPRQQRYANETTRDTNSAQGSAGFASLPHNQVVSETEPHIVWRSPSLPNQVFGRVSNEGISAPGGVDAFSAQNLLKVCVIESQDRLLESPFERKLHRTKRVADSVLPERIITKQNTTLDSNYEDRQFLTIDKGDGLADKGRVLPVPSTTSDEVSQRLLLPSYEFEINSLKANQAIPEDRHISVPRTTRSVTPADFFQRPKQSSPAETAMAPVRDPNSVENSLKDAIQKLYEVQSQVHGFVPETQPLLIEKMTELAQSLAHIQTLTSPTLSPNNPIHKNRLAPEVIDYVDDSRNPDIYNREFVELVQRGNAVMNGKQQAFRDFSHIFADALKEGMPELSDHVDQIMENAGFSGNRTDARKTGAEAANGAVKTEKK